MFASCIMAMVRGLLHVDAINMSGRPLAVVHIAKYRLGYHIFDFDLLWDKYWGLGPDVTIFWSAMITDYSWAMLTTRETDILRNTPALWSDLALVQRFAAKDSWLEREVHSRIRASLRFAWTAAIVLL